MSEDPYEIPVEDYEMIECMECGNSLADCVCNDDDSKLKRGWYARHIRLVGEVDA